MNDDFFARRGDGAGEPLTERQANFAGESARKRATSLPVLRLATLTHDRARRYFLNTPRLPTHERADTCWHVSFADARVDELFRLDVTPRPEGEIRELLGLDDTYDVLSTESPLGQALLGSSAGAKVRYQGPKRELGVTVVAVRPLT